MTDWERTSPWIFLDQITDPSFWSKAITLPSTSDITDIPKPDAVPDERDLNCFIQLTLPEEISIDFTLPLESAK